MEELVGKQQARRKDMEQKEDESRKDCPDNDKNWQCLMGIL